MRPERLWWWSTQLHQRGWSRAAKLLKLANFVLFKAVLPVECRIQPDVELWHRGMGTVIHPNTTIGRRVRIAHQVTVSVYSQGPGPWGVVIEDGVTLGTGCLVASRARQQLTVGENAEVGAHAVVTRDVSPGARMVGPTATDLRDRTPPGS